MVFLIMLMIVLLTLQLLLKLKIQVVEATQNTDVFSGHPGAPTEDVVDLEEIRTTKLKKTPVPDVTLGEKSSNEPPSNITTPPSLKTKEIGRAHV